VRSVWIGTAAGTSVRSAISSAQRNARSVGAYFGVARIGAATDGITLCGVEHKRDGVIGREVANIALLMFAEKPCASATKIL
jgi:hypothetical protein